MSNKPTVHAAAAQGVAAAHMPLFHLLEEEFSITKRREDWCSIARGISVLIAFTADELLDRGLTEREAAQVQNVLYLCHDLHEDLFNAVSSYGEKEVCDE